MPPAGISRRSKFRPDDLAVRNQLGDLLWDAGRPDEAEHWYRAALALEPTNAWADPSLLAVRWERTSDLSLKEELEEYALEHLDNPRARDMLDRVGPYFGSWLPEPGEASLGLVRMMVEKWEEGEDIQVQGMYLSSLEAPSVYLAYDLQMEREGKRGRLQIDVESIPRPDVRRPRVPVHYQVWCYRGTEPLQNLTEPPERATEAISRIAALPFHLKTWLKRAAEVGPQHFGPGRVLGAGRDGSSTTTAAWGDAVGMGAACADCRGAGRGQARNTVAKLDAAASAVRSGQWPTGLDIVCRHPGAVSPQR